MQRTTVRAEPDVAIPDSFQTSCQGQIRIAAFEFLIPLKPENELKIFGFHAVAQKPIVADFLKAGRKQMHQKTADKAFVFQSDLPLEFTRFPTSG